MYRYDYLNRDIPNSITIFNDGDYIVGHHFDSGKELYDKDFSKVMNQAIGYLYGSGYSFGGKIIIKNPGNSFYKATSTIEVNKPCLIIEGEGVGGTNIAGSPLIRTYLDIPIFRVTSEACIRNLQLWGNGPTGNAIGIKVETASKPIYISNIHFAQFNTGLYVNYTYNSMFERLKFYGNNVACFLDGDVGKYNIFNLFEKCVFGNANNIGLKIRMSNWNVFHACDIEGNNDVGVQIRGYASGNKFEECWFEGNTNYDIDLNETDPSVYVRWTRFEGGHLIDMKVIIGSSTSDTLIKNPVIPYQQMISSITDNGVNTKIITFDSKNYGIATLPSGSTRVTVPHGLYKAPKIVLLTPQGNIKVWVENITNTSFDIVTDTAPTTNISISWHAKI